MSERPFHKEEAQPFSQPPPRVAESADLEGSLLANERAARERRAQRSRERHGISLNLVPMIDVVFLLLTYFLLTTNFTVGEEVFHLELPDEVRGGAQPIDPFDLPEQPLIVTVTSTGDGPGDYRLSMDLPTTRPISSADNLFSFLNSQRYGPDNRGGLLLPDTPIIIRPAGSARWEHAVEVFNACLRARFVYLRFAEPM